MKPIKCNNCKMFYDGDKYESCPHCKAATTEENEEKAVEKEVSQRSVTGRRTEKKTTQKDPEKKVTEKKTTEKRDEEEPPKKKKFGDIFKKKTKEEIEEEVVSEEVVPEIEEPKKTTKTEKGSSSKKVSSKRIEEEEDEEEEIIEEEIDETEDVVDDEPEEDDEDIVPASVPSIKDAVQRADSTANSADEKTVAFYNFSNAIEPVVGWIICVEGEYMGESFSLKSGRNNIGRSLAMDIALAKEKSVSRERHASITFEPNQKKFYIQSGESSGLTYVNGELIMMFTELKDYDVITLGQSRYVFLRLCGKKFSWDDYT